MRTFLLLILVCAAPAYTFAQTHKVTGSARSSVGNSTVPYEYQGCVTRTGTRFLLTTQSGKAYVLVSGGVALASYVGANVKLRATDINPNDPSSGERSVAAGGPANGERTLDVYQISTIGGQCSPPKQQ